MYVCDADDLVVSVVIRVMGRDRCGGLLWSVSGGWHSPFDTYVERMRFESECYDV